MYEHFKEQGSLSLDPGGENISNFARVKLSTYQVHRFQCVTCRTIEDTERIRLFIFSQIGHSRVILCICFKLRQVLVQKTFI